ncbi:MAG TPA: hypothetical protein ENJ70_00215 [Thermoplasmatales archaeon]|jgi:putative heme iron utilization protein|nr:hypothetical protein [Thermoplasmatales archaeon]
MNLKIISMALALLMVASALPFSSSSNAADGKKIMVDFVKIKPGGVMETMSREIEVGNGDVGHAIAMECARIFHEDKEMEYYASLGVYFIISAGEGLHFSLPPSLVQSSRLHIFFSLFPSIIYCSYHGNASETNIVPITPPGNETYLIGDHRLLCGGFMGVIGWTGMFSYENTGFAGVTLFFWTDKA